MIMLFLVTAQLPNTSCLFLNYTYENNWTYGALMKATYSCCSRSKDWKEKKVLSIQQTPIKWVVDSFGY